MPLLAISSLGSNNDESADISAKALVSSLNRSLFSGTITVFRKSKFPLFRIERCGVNEVCIDHAARTCGDELRQTVNQQFYSALMEYIKPERHQWVLVANAAGLSLRNIDHLIQQDSAGPYPPLNVDFLWASAESDGEASTGLWAVRGEHLPLVLEKWEAAFPEKTQKLAPGQESKIWSQVVRSLPLRKRRFEKGEVVAPRIGALDWALLSDAAYVTVPDWPEEAKWKFLQSLYFGTYLGDKTGMMLNVLDA